MSIEKSLLMRIGFEHWFTDFHKSLVVLANPKTLINDRYASKEVKSKVIRADQLINTLKKYKSDSKSSRKQLLELGNKILSINHVDRKDYIEKFNTLKESLESEVLTEHESTPTTIITSSAVYPSHTPDDSKTPSEPEEKLCPRCGSKMVLRTAKKGNYQGDQFWGCSRYPKCRYIENLIPDHD